jgi:hypothetical protein
MYFINGFCNGNATSAVAEYQRQFPGQIFPNKQTFMAVVSFNIFIGMPPADKMRKTLLPWLTQSAQEY